MEHGGGVTGPKSELDHMGITHRTTPDGTRAGLSTSLGTATSWLEYLGHLI